MVKHGFWNMNRKGRSALGAALAGANELFHLRPTLKDWNRDGF